MTNGRHATICLTAIISALLLVSGCSTKSSSEGLPSGPSLLPIVTVKFSGTGHWEEAHPHLGGQPTSTINANVTWQIVYEVDFDARQVKVVSRSVTGTGLAAHAEQVSDSCSGPIVPDPTQNGPTLDLTGSWPTTSSGSATFLSQAMGGSAFHICDPAWATGIHAFPTFDNIRGDARVTINLADWGGNGSAPKTTLLPTVDAQETQQENASGPPATLNVHWEGSFTVSEF